MQISWPKKKSPVPTVHVYSKNRDSTSNSLSLSRTRVCGFGISRGRETSRTCVYSVKLNFHCICGGVAISYMWRVRRGLINGEGSAADFRFRLFNCRWCRGGNFFGVWVIGNVWLLGRGWVRILNFFVAVFTCVT